jgi:hypothetical protein
LKFIYAGAPSKFSEGSAAVKLSDESKPVFIDKQGQVVLQPQADSFRHFTKDLPLPSTARVATSITPAIGQSHRGLLLSGYINREGKLIISHQFDWAGPFPSGLPQSAASKAQA